MTETRKLIELPSGARVKIRRLSQYDILSLPPEKRTDPTKIDGVDLARIVLTRCAGQIRFPDGTRKKIVDAHFDTTDDLTEISIEEIDQADAQAIIDAVTSLSNPPAVEQPA
jgi:hypothetical protein